MSRDQWRVPPRAHEAVVGGSSLGTFEIVKIPWNRLDFVQQLGSGAFGKVILMLWNTQEVAVKLINNADQDVATETANEARVLAALHHPCVVSLYGIVVDTELALVMEYCSRGTLADYLKNNANTLDDATKLEFALQITSGLAYLHEHDVLHRDIKSSNVMLDRERRCKLIDFGFANVKQTTSYVKVGSVGALLWTAPEIVSADESGAPYSAATDIYSLGITLWEIASCKLPYAECNSNAGIVFAWKVQGKHDSIPAGTPTRLGQVIVRCRSQNPSDRPSARALIELFVDKQQAIEASKKRLEDRSGSVADSNEVGKLQLEIESLRIQIDNERRQHQEELRQLNGENVQLEIIDWNHLRDEFLLKKGEYSEVRRMKWMGETVAVKFFLDYEAFGARQCGNHSFGDRDLIDLVQSEANAMAALHHPCIVSLYGITVDAGGCGLVMEYCSGGTLSEYLWNKANAMDDAMKIRMACQITSGIAYLHAHGVVHRDIKSGSVMLDAEQHCKLIDFGFSHLKQKIDTSYPTSPGFVMKDKHIRMQLVSMAPENLSAFHDSIPYNKSTDMYALGITLWEIVTRETPYQACGRDFFPKMYAWKKEGKHDTIPDDAPVQLINIIEACRKSNPEDRPSAADVLVELERA
jgi:serine/threonine protein kinase